MSRTLFSRRRRIAAISAIVAASLLVAVVARGQDPPKYPAEIRWNAAFGLFSLSPSAGVIKELDAERGQIVLAVTRGGAAEKAGVRRGDLVTLSDVWDKPDKSGFVELRRGATSLKLLITTRAHDLKDFKWAEEPAGTEKRTLTVRPDGSGTTRTITAALLQARAGDTVVAADGLYDELLMPSPGVTLAAEEGAEVRIAAGLPLRLIAAGDAVVRGLALRGDDIAALILRSTNVELRDCDLASQNKMVLGVVGSDDVRVMNCRLAGGGKNTAVDADHAKLKLEHTSIVGAERGVNFAAETQAEMTDCLIDGAKYAVVATGSRLTARGNSFNGNDDGTGIFATQAAVVELAGNFIRRFQQGVYVMNARVDLTRNTIGQNAYGIYCNDGEIVAADNFISNNRLDGLRFAVAATAKSEKQSATLRNNRITGQGQNGVYLERCTAVLSHNLLESNNFGIVAENVKLEAVHNTIVLHRLFGLDLKPLTSGKVESNIIAYNGMGLVVDVTAEVSRSGNVVYANYASKSLPLTNGNFARRDRLPMTGGETLHVVAYPADDLQSESDAVVDPQFVRIGEDYRLKAESPLVKPGADPNQIAGAFSVKTSGADPFFSLAGEKLLAEMKLSEAVTIDAFFGPDLPEWLVPQREACKALLKQLELRYPGKVTVRFPAGDPLTDEVIEEARLKGIPLRRYAMRDTDELETGKALCGVAFSTGDKEAAIPQLDRAASVEYQLLHALDAFSDRPRKAIGLVTTEAKILGGLDLQNQILEPTWALVHELRKQYDIVELGPEQPASVKIDALVVVQPSSLTPEGLAGVLYAIRHGTPTVLFEDPSPIYARTTSGTAEPRRPQRMFDGPPPRPKADLAELWKTLGLRFTADRVIWQDHNPFTAVKPWHKELVVLDEESGAKPAFAPSDASTFGLRRMVLPFAGEIERAPDAAQEFVPLLRTGTATGTVERAELVTRDATGNSQLNPDRKRVATSQPHVMAAQIRDRRPQPEVAKVGAGPADAATRGMNVIIVGDVDFMSPGFLNAAARFELSEHGRNFELDNLNFALNAIDSLAGDLRFVPIRSRRAADTPPQTMLALSSTSKSGGADWRAKVVFENDRPASLGPLPNAFPIFKAWTESEKSRMLACLERLHEKWPGMVERVTAERNLRLYRQARLIREALLALAAPGYNAFIVGDRAFRSAGAGDTDASELDLVTAHELIHLIDGNAVPNLTELEEWKSIAKPQIDRVAARLKALDPQLTIKRANADPQRYREIAWGEGMPRIYACVSLQEALACQAERIMYPQLIADRQEAALGVPSKVDAFLRKYVLDAEVRVNPAAVSHALGLAAMEERRFEDALTAFNSVIEQCDRSASAYIHRAEVLGFLNRKEEALSDLAIAIGLGDESAYRTRGRFLAELKRSEEALESLSTFISKRPEDERAYEDRGLEYLRVKQFAKAREDFRKAIELNSSNYTFVFDLGNSYFQEGNYDEAIDYFTRTIDAERKLGGRVVENSVTFRALILRSFAWQLKNRPEKQVEDLSALIAIAPRQVNYYDSRVKAYERLNQYDKAADDYTRLIELQPENADYLFKRGNARRLTGKNAEAIADYKQFLKKNPKGIGAYYYLGEIHRAQGELDLALADYDAFLKVSPDGDTVLYSRALAWKTKGDNDKALADFDGAIRVNAKESVYFLERGQVLATKGEYDKAIIDFDQALRLSPRSAAAFVHRGRVWSSKKDYDKAIADYDQCIALSPQDAYAFYLRGYARNGQKEFVQGVADLRESIRLDPEYANSRNSLAWLQATCVDAQFRNGREAVEHALKACGLSQEKNSDHLGTLAAAYAEAGDFDQAIRWETKAIEVNSTGFDKAAAQERMKLYQQKQPYRQPQ